jgi:hypothetical protein
MKAGHWLIALIVVGALAWWTYGHPGYETRAQREARYDAEQHAVEAATPKLYRWRDANGTLQLTDKPPKGRKYQVVDTAALENENVIPMSDAINPPGPATSKPSR